MDSLTPLEIKGEASNRTLHFFWLLDISSSMSGKKIQTLNWAIKEVIPALEDIENNERIKIMMRAIIFGDRAKWHIGPDAIPLNEFLNKWKDLEAYGLTNTAEAIELLIDELDIEKMGGRNVPPVCILISDGYCTSESGRFNKAINKLNSIPWGKKAVRLSIGIADNNSSYNKDELDMFITPYLRKNKIETLHSDNPKKLANYIKIASTEASISSSKSRSNNEIDTTQNPVNLTPEQLNPNNIDITDASEEF